MGNTSSLRSDDEPEDIWWTNASTPKVEKKAPELEQQKTHLSEANIEKLNEFKLELARKHEKRREIIAEKRAEMEALRMEVKRLQEENEALRSSKADVDVSLEIERLRKENEELRNSLAEKTSEFEEYEVLIEKNRALSINIAEMQNDLQQLNSEIVNFEKEKQDYQNHVVALKDVIRVSKQMLVIREAQLNQLKDKVKTIEETLASREMNILSEDLRNEYERQLQNIRNLRSLYEERQRADRIEKKELKDLLETTKRELESEQKKNGEQQERISELEEENSKKYDQIKSLESNLGLSKAEARQYEAELSVINQLFSEILLGFSNSQGLDLDNLIKILEEHHGLLQNIVVNEISTEVSSALPKVLLNLVSQANDIQENADSGESFRLETIIEESESQTSSLQMNTPEEIVENLPKVWKVLIELLNQQKAPQNQLMEDSESKENPCYKTVQTPKGPSLVLSVSQTFIRLKDLILEKKSLEKETNNLKQLNTHLESRLQDQEKRLVMVSDELNRTWHIVGKLQKQHQMLHTQEKILRYELAQKRKLLTELKEKLESSRESWLQAREKNSSTEEEWKKLRNEFASRRTSTLDENNSCESGYSDEREGSSSDDERSESEIWPKEATKESSNALGTDQKTDLVQSDEKTKQSTNIASSSGRSLEEILKARDERFKRLEGECAQLVTQVTNTNNRSLQISNKLDDLHETYGEASSSATSQAPQEDPSEPSNSQE